MSVRSAHLTLVVSLFLATQTSPPADPAAVDHCPPLPPPVGATVTVSTEAHLLQQATYAAPGTTVLIAAGTYNLQGVVHVVNDGITLRGASGDRADVVLDGGGMLTGSHIHAILIEADGVTVADLTIRNADEHGISINGSDRPTLYNLHIVDTGYQLVKVNPLGDGSEDGLLACSRLEYTTTAPEDYTNGISAHDAHGWTVRDNEWYRIRTPGNTPVPTILFWSGSSSTMVERNRLVDCAQGIAFGNASHSGVDHSGGTVRNNFIIASQPHDVVIEMVHAEDWLVAHNTALLLNPVPELTWGMEARYPESDGTFAYNLTNMPIWADRDGASALSSGNVTAADPGWFVDPAAGDLHLLPGASGAIDQAVSLAAVTGDIDGQARPVGSAPDVGADEVSDPAPATVTDLHLSDVVTSTTTLTAVLAWSPPASAITVALRTANTLIHEANWTQALPISDTLPGNTRACTAVLPYSGNTTYFALRAQNQSGEWSTLSNNAFTPHFDLYLPCIIRQD